MSSVLARSNTNKGDPSKDAGASVAAATNKDAAAGDEAPNKYSRFENEGVVFKAKLIGSELVMEPRGDKMCQSSIQRLKAIIKGTNSHKRRVVLKISYDGVKVFDEKTNEILHHHKVSEISYIASDDTDNRTFGYICDIPNKAHQFICFKTSGPAIQVMTVISSLFEAVLERSSNPNSNLNSKSKSKSSSNSNSNLIVDLFANLPDPIIVDKNDSMISYKTSSDGSSSVATGGGGINFSLDSGTGGPVNFNFDTSTGGSGFGFSNVNPNHNNNNINDNSYNINDSNNSDASTIETNTTASNAALSMNKPIDIISGNSDQMSSVSRPINFCNLTMSRFGAGGKSGGGTSSNRAAELAGVAGSLNRNLGFGASANHLLNHPLHHQQVASHSVHHHTTPSMSAGLPTSASAGNLTAQYDRYAVFNEIDSWPSIFESAPVSNSAASSFAMPIKSNQQPISPLAPPSSTDPPIFSSAFSTHGPSSSMETNATPFAQPRQPTSLMIQPQPQHQPRQQQYQQRSTPFMASAPNNISSSTSSPSATMSQSPSTADVFRRVNPFDDDFFA